MFFKDRTDAAKQLSLRLQSFRASEDTLVAGITPGGVPIARVIAKELSLTSFVVQVKKIKVASHDHVTLGAISENGIAMFNEALIEILRVPQEGLHEQLQEAKRIFEKSCNDLPDVKDKHVILVDEGIATGITMKVAIASLITMEAKKIQVATPVISSDALRFFEKHMGEVVYLVRPIHFHRLEEFYKSFPILEEESVDILSK